MILRDLYAAYRWLLSHSALFSVLCDQFHGYFIPPDSFYNEFDEQGPKSYMLEFREGLDQIVHESLNHGTKIVFVSFVALPHEGLEFSYRDNPPLWKDLYLKSYNLSPGSMGRIYNYVNRVLRGAAQELGIPYLDIAKDFPKEIRYFPSTFIHLGPEGNHLFAARLADLLAQNILPELVKKRNATRSS